MKIALVVTGAVSACHLPFWINWFEAGERDVDLRVVLTRSARRFVTPDAVSALLGRACDLDEWSSTGVPLHRELEAWAEVFLVHPASLHYVARLAGGLADTPSLLTLQCTQAPIGLAPALPPGANANPIVTGQLEALARRENVVVGGLSAARSASSGEIVESGPISVPELLNLTLERAAQRAGRLHDVSATRGA